jgi:hypothetical protein
MSKNMGQQYQQIVDQRRMTVRRHAELRAQKEVNNGVAASLPHYEKKLVRENSLRECRSNDKIITNENMRCMQDHYNMVLVSGNQ